MTQTELILEWFKSNDMLDRSTAGYDLGIFELASRIGDLEKLGYIFDKKKVTRKNRFGDSFNCTEYRLIGRTAQ